MPHLYQRNVVVANKVARILGILSFVLLATLVVSFGPNINTPIIFGLGGFFFLITYLNNYGWDNLGRTLLCIIPAILTLLAALLAKIDDPASTDILYYDSRFFLALFTIVPCLVFSTSESLQLYGCLGVIFLILILFDPIHELFQVGYFQRGFTGRSYYYINYVAVITFFGIAAGAISLKRVIEKTELQNQEFRLDVMEKNKQLSEALNNMETQHEEIIAQREELYSSQEQLMAAKNIIEKQKLELQRQVKQVNSDLHEANEELIKHNNDLRQFSYTISHNLRGPIARLLGLANVAHLDANVKPESDTMTIINHIRTSAGELDHVIRDLNEIIDLRNGIYQLRQPVEFSREWGEVKSLLHISDEMESRNFYIDFSEAPQVVSVKPMINSILFNLISNAIKYQSPERELQVSVRTYYHDSHTVLEVSDNGLGIDLKLFKKDIFKMYKRFHSHQEGKGLGLYLIKSQAESLNGFVEITSEPDNGTVFRVHVKNS